MEGVLGYTWRGFWGTQGGGFGVHKERVLEYIYVEGVLEYTLKGFWSTRAHGGYSGVYVHMKGFLDLWCACGRDFALHTHIPIVGGEKVHVCTVKPPIKDTPKEDKPPNKGHNICIL